MMLKKTLFLAGFTRRSQAYLQTLVNSELYPQSCLFFGDEAAGLPGQTNQTLNDQKLENFFNPNFDEPLLKTVQRAQIPYQIVKPTSINDLEIYQKIKHSDCELIIYSGYGAQLVGQKLIGLGIPLLHVHTGWLPEYRGSTTFYYALLQEGRCGVSALFLNEKIDEGKIVARAHYPAPKGVDADYSYDSIIRADLLVKILKQYQSTGKFPLNETQVPGGCTYYVIHPLLKHLALMQCEQEK